MKELSLADVFRFLMAGAVVLGYFYFCDQKTATALFESLDDVVAVLILLACGSIIYLVYRPLIYNTFFLWLQDLLRHKTDNYRTFLRKEYSISRSEAALLWAEIRDRHFARRYDNLRAFASSIHSLYMAGLLAVPFAAWQLVERNLTKAVILGGISLFTLLAAILNDRYYEDRELGFLKSLDKQEIDSIAKYFTEPQKQAKDAN